MGLKDEVLKAYDDYIANCVEVVLKGGSANLYGIYWLVSDID